MKNKKQLLTHAVSPLNHLAKIFYLLHFGRFKKALFSSLLIIASSSAYCANILVEADLVRIESREMPAGSGIFRVFAVSLGPGPFRSSLTPPATEIEIAVGAFGGAQIRNVNIARMGFASRGFANGSIIYNASPGTWTGMSIWRVDAGGDVFDPASAGGNGVTVARAVGDAMMANRRVNITIPNLARYNPPGQRNALWLRMPTDAAGNYEGSLTGVMPAPPAPPAGPAPVGVVPASDNNLSFQDLTAQAANYDYDSLFDPMVVYLVPTVPAISTIGLIALSLLLLISAIIIITRYRLAHK